MRCEDISLAEVQEFIAKVRALPGCTDITEEEAERSAYLFLRARKRDVNRAIELYKANKRMRYSENVDSIDPLEDSVRRELISGKFTVLPGTDDDLGVTVAIFTAHRHWPPLTTHRDTLKGVLYQLDVAMMSEQSQRKGLIVLYDMRDTRYSNFDYHLCVKLLNLFRIFTVDLDEINIHLSPDLIEKWFAQLTEHRHFDWLRTCMVRSGHASRMPDDYFSSPPPLYRGLTQSGCDIIRCNPIVGTSRSHSFRQGSVRYRNHYWKTLDHQPNENPLSPTMLRTANGALHDVRNSPLSRCMSMTGNRMLSSMYEKTPHLHSPTLSSEDPPNFSVNRRSLVCSVNNNENSLSAESSRVNCTAESSSTRLSVDEFIHRTRTLGTIGLMAEFEAMFKEKAVHGSYEKFLRFENRRRNRYMDVPCLDSTAVSLSDGSYLHANWVSGYCCPRAYILAQGPLDNTRRDFWMAVWEYRVPVIVMLTKIVENQRIKCALYWPSKHGPHSNSPKVPSECFLPKSSTDVKRDSTVLASASYGEFTVNNLGESLEGDGLYRRTRLRVHRKVANRTNRKTARDPDSTDTSNLEDDDDSPLEVDHLLYLGWPDFDVPSDADAFLVFLDVVKKLHRARCDDVFHDPLLSSGKCSNAKPPLLIHCSAGIGRTGTFVTIDICLQQGLEEGFIDVPHVVRELRRQRAGSVQVAKQYAFIHNALATRLTKLRSNHADHS
ncbi:unnamed protein product [Calicophoron daubneyi]|uniref:Uncharacterized protein n=1 Tax=Calicophoron daubneyi TaxID=300641 RepID=A0AAV2SWX5_CALDB